MVHFVNLTPHDLNIVKEDGTILNILRTMNEEGETLEMRAEMSQEPQSSIEGIQVVKTTFGEPIMVWTKGRDSRAFEGAMPGPIGAVYVVSQLALQACRREEMFSIYTLVAPGMAVRDSAGNIVGAKGFSI